MTDEEADRIAQAARALIERLDRITTDDFTRGAERLEREALRNALKAARIETRTA